MMRREVLVQSVDFDSTPNESWTTTRGRRGEHWFEASTDFALEHLSTTKGKSCLVIGSPLIEAIALIDKGWDVTYLDVRKPPVKFKKFLQCDASKIHLPDESFDAVSTACVLTHVGLGRYGDPIVEHGDEKALIEIARVMKRGSSAAITFGAVVDGESTLRIGRAHRVYAVSDAERMLGMAGLSLVDKAIWSTAENRWRLPGEKPTKSLADFDYLSTFVRKPC